MKALAAVLVLAAALGAAAVLVTRPSRSSPSATVSVAEALGTSAGTFARATRPRTFAFPADHGPHPAYRNEWWYYTGNLLTADGRRFGYQLTFFRTGLVLSAVTRASAWAATDVYMAHFALTDVASGSFHPHVRFERGAAGLAGASARPVRVWTDDWSTESDSTAGPGRMRLRAAADDAAIDLVLDRGKPPVLEGDHGLSRKSAAPGNASYYYSLTRMPTRGTVSVNGRRFAVQGSSWMDREWSTSSLGDVVGWDWFALQLRDGRDVMFYRLRRADGTISPFSAGTLVDADGKSHALGPDDVRVGVLDTWTDSDGIRYPARWRLTIVPVGATVDVVPCVADQEYRRPIRYWEGAVDVRGSIEGVGYVELVGYGKR